MWRDSEAGVCTSQHTSPEGWQQPGRPLSNPMTEGGVGGGGRETEAECQGRTLTVKLTVKGHKYPSGGAHHRDVSEQVQRHKGQDNWALAPKSLLRKALPTVRLQARIILNGIEPGRFATKCPSQGESSVLLTLLFPNEIGSQ